MKRRKKALFERENGPARLASPEEAAELEQLEKLGVANAARSTDPQDYMWLGGKKEIDPYAIIDAGLSGRTALEDFDLARIDASPPGDGVKFRRSKTKPTRELRLEQGQKYIQGWRAKRGRSRQDYDPVLSRVALLYHRAYFGFENSEATLTELLARVLWPKDNGKSLGSKVLKRYGKEWKARRDRLLLNITETEGAYAGRRSNAVRKALELLGLSASQH